MASTSPNGIVGTLVRVWAMGLGTWGHLWIRHFGESALEPDTGNLTPTASMWARGLGEFQRAEVLAALEDFMLRGASFPPNLPELRRACVGIPSLAEVRSDLGRKTNPFTLLVWEKLDPWDFGHSDQRRAAAMLDDAYEWAVDQRMRGARLPALPPPPDGECEKSPRPAPTKDPQVARKWAATIARQLGAGGEKAASESGDNQQPQEGTNQ